MTWGTLPGSTLRWLLEQVCRMVDDACLPAPRAPDLLLNELRGAGQCLCLVVLGSDVCDAWESLVCLFDLGKPPALLLINAQVMS